MKRFGSDFRITKLKRFQMDSQAVDELLNDFTESQLVDTAYAAKLAGRYLGLLYGGEVDASGKRRVEKVAGRATALLRSSWYLNEILSENPSKNRGDHRHHTVDAMVLAVSSPAHVRLLSSAMSRSEEEGKRVAMFMEEPWPDFQVDVARCIREVVPSLKVNRRVRGGLHNESNFSPRRDEQGRPCATGAYVHIR